MAEEQEAGAGAGTECRLRAAGAGDRPQNKETREENGAVGRQCFLYLYRLITAAVGRKINELLRNFLLGRVENRHDCRAGGPPNLSPPGQ